eukprot:TRINITY_DN3775_c0_g2_i1.p1 TRINITY_DN3775_c0_g2~~TRINITY_DN3775_c0_g2_i1.p1  ORF type:complete len:165 (+),score=39.54 TRINITY_DN3775_c0_g2_i1:94-588(+)
MSTKQVVFAVPNIGSDSPMKWNPQLHRWEGNEHEGAVFDEFDELDLNSQDKDRRARRASVALRSIHHLHDTSLSDDITKFNAEQLTTLFLHLNAQSLFCKKWNQVIKDNERIWKLVVLKEFEGPVWKKLLGEEVRKHDEQGISWHQVYKEMHHTKKALHDHTHE